MCNQDQDNAKTLKGPLMTAREMQRRDEMMGHVTSGQNSIGGAASGSAGVPSLRTMGLPAFADIRKRRDEAQLELAILQAVLEDWHEPGRNTGALLNQLARLRQLGYAV